MQKTSLEIHKQFSPTKERTEKMQNMFFYDLKTVGMYAYLARTRAVHCKPPTSQKKHSLRISLISFPYRFRTTKDASTNPLIPSTTIFPHLILPRKVNKHDFERFENCCRFCVPIQNLQIPLSLIPQPKKNEDILNIMI